MRNLLWTLPIITLLLTLASAGRCQAQSEVQKLLDAFYPAPEQIRVESSDGSPLVKLQPYVSLDLGKEAEPFKWIVNKKPLVDILCESDIPCPETKEPHANWRASGDPNRLESKFLTCRVGTFSGRRFGTASPAACARSLSAFAFRTASSRF